jgi:hypothetical protein
MINTPTPPVPFPSTSPLKTNHPPFVQVSEVIEAAWARRHLLDEVEILMRGTKYIVSFSKMRQQLKTDFGRWREVKRKLL